MNDEVHERLESLSLDFFSGKSSDIIKDLDTKIQFFERAYRNITMEPEDSYIIIYGTRDMNESELNERQNKIDREAKNKTLDEMMEQMISNLEEPDEQ